MRNNMNKIVKQLPKITNQHKINLLNRNLKEKSPYYEQMLKENKSWYAEKYVIVRNKFNSK